VVQWDDGKVKTIRGSEELKQKVVPNDCQPERERVVGKGLRPTTRGLVTGSRN